MFQKFNLLLNTTCGRVNPVFGGNPSWRPGGAGAKKPEADATAAALGKIAPGKDGDQGSGRVPLGR